MADGPLDLFPYEMRPIQKKLVKSIDRTLMEGDHIIIEAGTGSGKTVSALAPSLSYAYRHGKRVLYLTRTNSQQKQVVEEFRRIRKLDRSPIVENTDDLKNDVVDEVMEELNRELSGEEAHEDFSSANGGPWRGGPGNGICVAIQGRNNLCPLTDEEAEFITGTPDELSKMCSERKKNTTSKMMGKPTGGKECRFFSAYLLDDGLDARRWAMEVSPTAEELLSKCLMMGICPYEVTKTILPDAVLVTAPYIYFLSPFIRRRLLEWMDCSIEDLVIIIDEAHNLSQFARELSSITLSTVTLKLGLAEVDSTGDHRIGKPFTIKNFIEMFLRALEDISEEYLIDEDGLVPPSALSEAMMMLFKTNSSRIDSMASEMLHHGQAIQDQKKAQGKLPRSYIHRVALFYKTWQELEFESFSPLINRGRNGELSLEAHAMDPSQITSDLLKAHASVHMSGTLSPLEEYRDTIGLPGDSPLMALPPPFPLKNRMIVFDQDLTTNYEILQNDPEMKLRFRERLERLFSLTDGKNTAVFFPSFDLMGDVLGNQELEDGTTLPAYLNNGRKFFIEKRGSSQADVMELASSFKESNGGVLVSVLGGRLSEGMDFPGRSLEAVIIVGIPYPKPNARQRALSAFYDIKFGKGWEYTVHAPAARRLKQAMGRMIRSEKERGFGAILDKRAKHFSAEFPDISAASEDLSEVSGFFQGKVYLE
jgi:DNA excision repair protein ERCC-2